MSKPVFRVFVPILVILVVLIGIYGLSSPRSISKAQERSEDLSGLLQELVYDEMPFLIVFIAPVYDARTSWTIPGEITDDGGIIGRRFVKEITADYICVDEIGQGATTTVCVPFTNIAYVKYNP